MSGSKVLKLSEGPYSKRSQKPSTFFIKAFDDLDFSNIPSWKLGARARFVETIFDGLWVVVSVSRLMTRCIRIGAVNLDFSFSSVVLLYKGFFNSVTRSFRI